MMNSAFHIPQGEEKITIELTVKEAMALTGQKFHEDSSVKSEAMRKLHEVVLRKYGMER
ncbi:hypothetical protein M3650_07840 [Paenibacillus sp. MER TA 81-3]|uniref:hypothetical protein n=1 Tax=Paenibacillus sp. MER TA 81-3 TaxID=2939573 RepID=UPI00204129BA|nr:hypothetical protein [Paenibacillus sp. MER TA 81-3]MCM3338545.1 hypothetical protein [Paenibacillus sp. MER TA 81-3]